MTRDENEKRLTPTQREMRDRCGSMPRHLRRSIDIYRVARGMPPLWFANVEQRRGKS